MSGVTLTPKQAEALRMLVVHGHYGGAWPRRGVVTSGETTLIDRQPWINWQTAEALERKGLARVVGSGEECEVLLAADGGA